MHDIDTALLRTFLTLADTRSFSRTGDLIGRSQSAVSGQLRRLEDALACCLIERDTRNVRLTADGERLRVHARQMVAAADAMLARFRDGDIAGEVRFGSPEDFASAYLPDILGTFAKAHERVELHVTCMLTRPLLAAFAAGQQDLIIIKGDPAQRMPGVVPLWEETLVWVRPSPWPLPTGPTVRCRWQWRPRLASIASGRRRRSTGRTGPGRRSSPARPLPVSWLRFGRGWVLP